LTGAPFSSRYYDLREKRRLLPAWQSREQFLTQLVKNQVLIIAGEPGTGKSTQFPQLLMEAGCHVQNGALKLFACTQPNCIAAMSAAQRVADELDIPVGTYVGYSARFEERLSVGEPPTIVRFMTDEMFVREAVLDPSFEKYCVILVDEAHQRTTYSDVLLGLLKGVVMQRTDLRLVVMSASTDVQRLQGYFPAAPVLCIPGQIQDVEVNYLAKPERDYLKAAIQAVIQIHSSEPPGDVLLFLTSQAEIEFTCSQLRRQAGCAPEQGELVVVPLYISLPFALQQHAFDNIAAKMERKTRKVVVTTGVAESSISIDGIVYVVDPGFALQAVYNPRTRLDTSLVSPVSKASAALRAALAGRSKPGKCFRLYSEAAYKSELAELTPPEILRSNLSTVALLLKKLGVKDLVHFDFMDPPAPEALMRALEQLSWLGFVDEQGDLTEVGQLAARFPVEPQLAKMLLHAPLHRCVNEALSIAAMISVPFVFVRPIAIQALGKAADEAKVRFAHHDGDHLTLLNVFHAYKQQVQDGADTTKFCNENFVSARSLKSAESIREQLRKLLEMMGMQPLSTPFTDKEYYPNIRRCILSGFFMQTAHLEFEKLGQYRIVKDGEEVSLHPSTVLKTKPEWLLYNEFIHTSRGCLRTITQVRPEWLLDLAPGYFDIKRLPKGEARNKLEKLTQERAATANP